MCAEQQSRNTNGQPIPAMFHRSTEAYCTQNGRSADNPVDKRGVQGEYYERRLNHEAMKTLNNSRLNNSCLF